MRRDHELAGAGAVARQVDVSDGVGLAVEDTAEPAAGNTTSRSPSPAWVNVEAVRFFPAALAIAVKMATFWHAFMAETYVVSDVSDAGCPMGLAMASPG